MKEGRRRAPTPLPVVRREEVRYTNATHLKNPEKSFFYLYAYIIIQRVTCIYSRYVNMEHLSDSEDLFHFILSLPFRIKMGTQQKKRRVNGK